MFLGDKWRQKRPQPSHTKNPRHNRAAAQFSQLVGSIGTAVWGALALAQLGMGDDGGMKSHRCGRRTNFVDEAEESTSIGRKPNQIFERHKKTGSQKVPKIWGHPRFCQCLFREGLYKFGCGEDIGTGKLVNFSVSHLLAHLFAILPYSLLYCFAVYF
jgi:hypothetical protein